MVVGVRLRQRWRRPRRPQVSTSREEGKAWLTMLTTSVRTARMRPKVCIASFRCSDRHGRDTWGQ